MSSPRSGMPKRRPGLMRSIWAASAVLGLIPAVGCQVEYAGMTLPSGKYMHDDVQYFAPGPAFPWANTQAATQRARMAAMGEVPPADPNAGQAGVMSPVAPPPAGVVLPVAPDASPAAAPDPIRPVAPPPAAAPAPGGLVPPPPPPGF